MTTESNVIKLWTYHPVAMQLDDPELRIDFTKGQYWNDRTQLREQYRLALPRLHELLSTDQLVWCYTTKDAHQYFPGKDEIEWEIQVERKRVVAFIDTLAWNQFLQGQNDDLSRLIVHPNESDLIPQELTALVKPPFRSGEVKRIGPLTTTPKQAMRHAALLHQLELQRELEE